MAFPTTPLLASVMTVALVLSSCGSEDTRSDPSTTAPTSSVAPLTTDPINTDPVAATEELFDQIDPEGPGCAVAVDQGGEIVFAQAWGSATLDPKAVLQPDTVFDMASITKQFTATAVLLLAEQGLIDLDASLSTYLPGLPAWGEEVSVGHAIHHTSGIADYIEALVTGGTDIDDPADTDAAYAAIAATDLLTPPGTAFFYSNSNYLILASIVETVSGRPFAEFVEIELLGPAGVGGRIDPTGALDGAAISYTRAGEGWTPVQSPWTQVGDGGLQTTPVDLALWGTQYWSPTVGGPDINAARIADAVATGGADDEVYGAGIGRAEIDGIGSVIIHLGGWEAFISTFLVAPTQQVAVVASCNAVELQPVRESFGLELLRIWLPTP